MSKQRNLGVWDLDLEKLNGNSGNEGIDLSDYTPRQLPRLNEHDSLVSLDRHEEPIRILHEFIRKKFNITLGSVEEFLYVESKPNESLAKIVSSDDQTLYKIKQNFSGANLDPFIQHQIIDDIAKKTGLSTVASYEIAERFNCKVEFVNLMNQIGIRLPDTEIITDDLWDFFNDPINEERFAKAVLKKSRGASGQGMKLGGPMEILEFYSDCDPEDIESGLVLQKMLDVSTSPSVVYETNTDGTFSKKTLSMQLLESESPELPPSVHVGNVYLPFLEKTAMDEMTNRIIGLCSATEAYGPAGSDFMITKDYQIYPAEINYRITGTFQYMELALKLMRVGSLKSNQVWAGMNISRGGATNDQILNICNSTEFDGNTIPTNLANQEKVMTLFIGDTYEEVMSLATNFEGQLSGKDNTSRNAEYLESVHGLVSDIDQGLLR